MGKISIAELRRMPASKKLQVYAGGEVRTVTAGWLLRQKEAARRREANSAKGDDKHA